MSIEDRAGTPGRRGRGSLDVTAQDRSHSERLRFSLRATGPVEILFYADPRLKQPVDESREPLAEDPTGWAQSLYWRVGQRVRISHQESSGLTGIVSFSILKPREIFDALG